jgi:ribosome-associated protein
MPSKNARKREQHELQALGEQLIGLPDATRRELPLGDRLHEAIDDIHRMSSHEAIRRQKQYIGKLMRLVDTEPIRALFAARLASDRQQKRLFAQAERWRDRLIAEPGGLAELSAETGGDTAAIGRMLAELEATTNERTERHLRRELFRAVHAALAAPAAGG